jgi:hypothetical protein
VSAGSIPTDRLVVAGLLVLLLGGIGYCLALYDAETQHTSLSSVPRTAARNLQSPEDKAISAPVIQHLQSDQRAHFAVLRTLPEGLPRAVRKILRQPNFGASWALAQRLTIDIPIQVWVVPGQGFLCIIDRQAESVVGVGCTPTRNARRHGLTTTLLDPPSSSQGYGRRFTFGLAPDGTREMLVETHGSMTTTPVKNGVFLLRDRAMDPPSRVKLIKDGRAR